MTAAILCPGLSLSRLSAVPTCDLSIAVNRAALAFMCDVWAATDYTMIRENTSRIAKTTKVLTRRTTWADAHRYCQQQPTTFTDDIKIDAPKSWQIKTITCAMAYAFTQGATRIDLYGCDWTGELDYDGVKAGEDRSDARWSQERVDALALMEWLDGNGVETVRH